MLKFSIRSIDECRNQILLLGKIPTDFYEENEPQVMMFLVNVIKGAQEYLEAKVLSKVFSFEDIDETDITYVYVSLEFKDDLTVQEFVYMVLNSFF